MCKKSPTEHRQADSPLMFLFRPFAYWRELCGIGFFIVWHWQILDISLDAKQSFFPGELGDSIHLFFFVSLTFLVLFLLECRVPPCFYRAGHDWLASTATLCMFSLLFSLPLFPQKGRGAKTRCGKRMINQFYVFLTAAKGYSINRLRKRLHAKLYSQPINKSI